MSTLKESLLEQTDAAILHFALLSFQQTEFVASTNTVEELPAHPTTVACHCCACPWPAALPAPAPLQQQGILRHCRVQRVAQLAILCFDGGDAVVLAPASMLHLQHKSA